MKHTNLILLFLVGSMMWVACHADCYISPSGSNAGNCTSDSPCQTINHCLQYAGDLTISLGAGTYSGSDNCQVTPTNTITSLIVQALPNNSVTIDCQNSYAHFYLSSLQNTPITIYSVTLLGGYSINNGGCLYASNVKNLTVQNVAFVSCNSLSNGGAIYTDSPTSIMDSTFAHNSASSGGGALSVNVDNLNSTTFSMSKSSLANNTAAQGGAIYIEGDYASITNCNITGNTATDGGALYLNTARPQYVGNYDFFGTAVSNNSATFGGGLYNNNLNHTFNVFGATFTNNSATVKLAATADPSIYCADPNTTFCYSCAASDCNSGCAAGNNQSCSLNAAAQAFCYSTKVTTCLGNSCKCSAKSGLSGTAKIVIVAIIACLVIGIFLIAIDVVRYVRNRKQGYTPIS